jgi:hypothetical protein
VPVFQSSKPEVNGFFKVSHMAASGLASFNDEKLMFATPECVRFWTALDERWNALESQSSVVGLVVEGPPGIGKSVGAWAWVCFQAMHLKKSGLWIHVDDFMLPSCVYLGPDGCKDVRIHPNLISDLMESTNVDFLVFDGYKSTVLQYKDVLKFMFPPNTKRLGIVISSLAGGIMPDQFGKYSPFIDFWEHGPWLLEHYFAACSNTDFFDTVRNNFDPFDDDVIGDPSSQEAKSAICRAQVEEKFYYAGASARWMFANTVHSVQAHVARYVDKVEKNFKQLLNEGHGIQSSESSNHLLMRYQGAIGPETFFVSRYALKLLLHASNDRSDIRRAYALAKQHNNPAFLGWVVEFDFLEQLADSCATSAKVFNLYSNVDGNIFWRVSSVTSFDPHSPFEAPWLPNQFRRPIKWNQGGYDAVVLFKDGGKIVLHFMQVTRGRTHKMKMKFFASLAAKVSAEYPKEDIGVEISLILPRLQDSKVILKSIPKIVNSGLLAKYRVGNKARHWPEQNEELEISTLYFDADFTNRRGRGFMRWLQGLLPGKRGGGDADAFRV